jgi:hypothetical protein
MKQIVINVEDNAFACVLGVLQLCQQVEVVSSGCGFDSMEQRDYCTKRAFEVLKNNGGIKFPYDFTWIYVAMNQYVVEGIDGFNSPQAYIDYLKELGVSNLPHRSTISNNCHKVGGVFPDWSFSDTEDPREVLRRKNVVKQFLSAFMRAKR